MKTKFTKFEWSLYIGSTGILEITDEKGEEIVTWQGFDNDKEFIENKANASLISCAPEMYDLLDSIENDNNQVPEFLWEKIQSVLAKARGEI